MPVYAYSYRCVPITKAEFLMKTYMYFLGATFAFLLILIIRNRAYLYIFIEKDCKYKMLIIIISKKIQYIILFASHYLLVITFEEKLFKKCKTTKAFKFI